MRFSMALVVGIFLGVAALGGIQSLFPGVAELLGIRVVQPITQTPGEQLQPSPTSTPVPTPTLTPTPSPTPTPTATPLPTPTPRLIRVDLEKAKMVHKTIYGEKGISVHLVHKVATLKVGDRVLLDKEILAIASGSCAAGIDYELRRPAIETAGARVAIRIPEPQILQCGLNSVEFFDGQGLLPAPTELYNQLHSQAAREIGIQAERSDLLRIATDNALTQIELYLRRLGFEEVVVRIDRP